MASRNDADFSIGDTLAELCEDGAEVRFSQPDLMNWLVAIRDGETGLVSEGDECEELDDALRDAAAQYWQEAAAA